MGQYHGDQITAIGSAEKVRMARFLHRPEHSRVLLAPYSAALLEHYARHGADPIRGHPYPRTLDEW